MTSIGNTAVSALRSDGRTSKRRGYRVGAMLFAAIAFCESAFLAAYLAGAVTGLAFLAQHVAASLIVVLLLVEQAGGSDDAAQVTVAGLATIVGGPFGAAGALLMMLGAGGRQEDDFDATWRAFLAGHKQDDGETFYDEICDGRTIDRTTSLPVNLEHVLRSGSLQDKQAALGAIATRYGTEFRPLLFEAIRNPSPPIRVQAAAVLTKLRNHERHRFYALIDAARAGTADARTSAAIIRDLIGIVHKDFLDRQQCAQAREAIEALLERLADQRNDDGALLLKRCRALLDARFYGPATALLDAIAERGAAA